MVRAFELLRVGRKVGRGKRLPISSATLKPLVELPARLLLPAFFLGDDIPPVGRATRRLANTRASGVCCLCAKPCALPHLALLSRRIVCDLPPLGSRPFGSFLCYAFPCTGCTHKGGIFFWREQGQRCPINVGAIDCRKWGTGRCTLT